MDKPLHISDIVCQNLLDFRTMIVDLIDNDIKFTAHYHTLTIYILEK